MNFKAYRSSSSGNLYSVSDGTTKLLIECGVSMKVIREALGFRLSGFSGCLVSHGHSDHSKSATELMRHGINCFMSSGTAMALRLSLGKYHRLYISNHGRQFSVGDFKIFPFETVHDCEGSLGFLISSGNSNLLFAVDTARIDYRFRGLTHICIECNYSEKTLSDDVEPSVRSRLIGSHFSLEDVKDFLAETDLSLVREIHLLHLSSRNADPVMFRDEIEKMTGKPVFVAER